MKPLIIAIDGPSGAGKGTLARAVADALRYRHVDTGAMYRAVAWKAVRDNLPLDDDAALSQLAESAAIDQRDGRIAIDGHDVTREIRTPEMDRAAASVARIPGVRSALVARQRALGAERGVVMEGRDIGTVVFPEADVKVYLDASAEERARRRASDAAHTGDSRRAWPACRATCRPAIARTAPAPSPRSRSRRRHRTSTRPACAMSMQVVNDRGELAKAGTKNRTEERRTSRPER